MNIRHSLLGLFLPLSLLSCHTVEKEADGRPLSSYVNPFVGASTNTELAGATPGVVRPMSTREADRAYRKAWRKNNPAWYTRLWRFLAKKR